MGKDEEDEEQLLREENEKKKKKMKPVPKLVMNVANTRYEAVRWVGKRRF